jgi:hypothetical protein
MFEPFQRFLIRWKEGKPLKRFWESDAPLVTRLKPSENEMKSLSGVSWVVTNSHSLTALCGGKAARTS